MSDEPENPKAFPTGNFNKGMTLRDYFAGQALAGILARTSYTEKDASRIAYVMASAMLVEREGIPR